MTLIAILIFYDLFFAQKSFMGELFKQFLALSLSTKSVILSIIFLVCVWCGIYYIYAPEIFRTIPNPNIFIPIFSLVFSIIWFAHNFLHMLIVRDQTGDESVISIKDAYLLASINSATFLIFLIVVTFFWRPPFLWFLLIISIAILLRMMLALFFWKKIFAVGKKYGVF